MKEPSNDAHREMNPESAVDDLELVDRILAGEVRAFEPLVRRHERRVFRVTLAILGNIEDAEEAMQDTFVKAYRHLGQFRRESRFTTWLTRIAINEALQRRHAQRNFVPIEDAETAGAAFTPQRYESWRADPEKLHGKQEIRRMIEEAIESLAPIYREVLVLRDVEGLSAEEAADVLGLKIPAMKSRLLRARLMVREQLAGALEHPSTLKRKIVTRVVEIREAVTTTLIRVAGR
ncbi:MAG: sigma-70 family RNA polymerase sigma factor [Candidatus Acidiferrales bacterium]